MSALVELAGVEKRFGAVTAVHRLDLEIASGEFIAIMGPSGCGKTTTLRMLAGLEAPSAGEIRIAGQVMNDVAPHERDTPMVWQSLALFPFLNARENVEFGLKMRGVAGGGGEAACARLAGPARDRRDGRARGRHALWRSTPARGACPQRLSRSRRCCCWTSPSPRSMRIS